MTDLIARVKGSYNAQTEFFDKALEDGAILIDQDDYDSSLDRIYDVKALKDIYILIQNTGGANGLTYKVQQARKEFTLLADLVDADFVDGAVAEATVASGAEAESVVARASGEITALRLRVKRATASNDTTMAGEVVTRPAT